MLGASLSRAKSNPDFGPQSPLRKRMIWSSSAVVSNQIPSPFSFNGSQSTRRDAFAPFGNDANCNSQASSSPRLLNQ
jgi:hypothetical protein